MEREHDEGSSGGSRKRKNPDFIRPEDEKPLHNQTLQQRPQQQQQRQAQQQQYQQLQQQLQQQHCVTGVLLRDSNLFSEPIENEYEDLDEDFEDVDDQETASRKKAEYEQILRAQEPATINNYGDIKITPFNLDDELEEGEFDEAGNFIRSKKGPENEDEDDKWAESIDWDDIERKEREAEEASKLATKAPVPNESTNNEESHARPQEIDRLTCYKQMLRIMRPDETVQITIRRLGNSVPKRRPYRLKPGRSDVCPMDTGNPAEVAEARRRLDTMIELAHQRLEDGDMDIYQKSFENLEEAIN